MLARCVIAVACMPGAALPARAADFTGYGVLTTDYVFRSVSYSDGHPAVQAGADVALEPGLYFGVWGSSVDLDFGSTQRDLQVNYYLGYERDLRGGFRIGANAVAYTFPGTEGVIDYDFEEYSVVASHDDRVWLEYSYSPDLFHSGRHTHNVDLYAEWPMPANLTLGAGAGYYDVSALSGSGYGYWQLGLTRNFRAVAVDLRYHDAGRAVQFISTPEDAKARVVLSVRAAF